MATVPDKNDVLSYLTRVEQVLLQNPDEDKHFLLQEIKRLANDCDNSHSCQILFNECFKPKTGETLEAFFQRSTSRDDIERLVGDWIDRIRGFQHPNYATTMNRNYRDAEILLIKLITNVHNHYENHPSITPRMTRGSA